MARKLTFKKPNRPSFKRSNLKKPNLSRLRTTETLILVLFFVGGVIFGTAGFVWYKHIFSNTERVFYGMLEKNLETDSVTRSVHQTQGAQTTNQSYYTEFSPKPLIESISKVEQVGRDRKVTSVTTHTVATKDSDYVQYTEINLAASDQGRDFSKLLNQWAQRTENEETGEKPQFINEAIFTFIPFGNLSQENREDLLQLIKQKKVYEFRNGDISYQEGRPIMTMIVTIKPKALIEVLLEYSKMTGIGDQDMLDPAQYENAGNVGLELKIDMLSRHLQEINFPGQTRSEKYTAYGLNRSVKLPTNTISIDELQSRVDQ